MKFIVLLRHGIAEDKGAGKSDFDRQLTEEGRRKIKDVARAIADVFPEAQAIWSSPLVRAMQTAEAVARAYGGRMPVEQTDSLVPGATPRDFRKFLGRTGEDFAVFAGHEPTMTEIMLDLTSIRAPELSMKKGGFYGLRFDDGIAHLEWMVPPKVVRA